MTLLFVLDAALPDDIDDGEKSELQTALGGTSDEIVFLHPESVRIHSQFPEDQRTSYQYAAIFVPPTLVESSFERFGKNLKAQRSSSSYKVFDGRIRARLSQTLLSMIHPFLEHNFSVKAILSTRMYQSYAPSDIVMLDLSHSPTAAISDLMEVTNCESIHCGPEAILKMLFISSMNLYSAKDQWKRAHPSEARGSLNQYDIPSCPVCLHRIDPLRLGLPSPKNQHLCSKFCQSPSLVNNGEVTCHRQRLLRPWPMPANCNACQTIRKFWKIPCADETMELFCYQCAMSNTLWVCLTCGVVGCGRYSNKHAEAHYLESGHPYCLELSTLRIWDYVHGAFAHRTDLLECPSSPPVMRPWLQQERAPPVTAGEHSLPIPKSETIHSAGLDEKSPKKATMIGEEYEALLQSALEEQAQHYEGEITRLFASLTAEQIDLQELSNEEAREVEQLRSINVELRKGIEKCSAELLRMQAQEAGHRATSQRLLREQQLAQELLAKIREDTAKEQAEGRLQVEELEQQIADLTANQRMRSRFSQDEELLNAQIFGTATSVEKKPAKKGKKVRRFFRK